PIPSPPPPSLGSELVRFAWWLAAQEGRAPRRVLGLLAETEPSALLHAWAGWWSQVRGLSARIERARAGHDPQVPDAWHGVASDLGGLRARLPPPFVVRGYLDRLRRQAEPAAEPLGQAMMRALRQLPASPPPGARAWLFLHWTQLAGERRAE